MRGIVQGCCKMGKTTRAGGSAKGCALCRSARCPRFILPSRRQRTLLANAIGSARGQERAAPSPGDHEGRPAMLRMKQLLRPVHSRGDPRGRPAGSLHALVPLHSHCHSPAESAGGKTRSLQQPRAIVTQVPCLDKKVV